MLFQKEKEDKNQINRLDQKRERRSQGRLFLFSPISRKPLSEKVSPCTFLKKASLTLETALVLPMFFFGVIALISFMDIYRVQTEHLTGLCQKTKEAGMYAYGTGSSRSRNCYIAGCIFLSAYRWSDSASKNMVPQHGKGSCMDRSAL